MWDFLKRIKDKIWRSPDDYGVTPLPRLKEPKEDSGGERIGLHVVREVLLELESGRILLADFQGQRNQPVFIKQYPALGPAMLEEPPLQRRLQVELAAVSQIRHKYLYPLREYELSDDVHLVFDVVPTMTLQDLLDRVTLTPTEAVAYVERLLEIADMLHTKGLKFGEIRPGTIWLTKSKDPRLLTGQWVLDYEFQRRAEKLTASRSDIHRGGVDYTAPEVLRGEAADLATDQYIIGAILYRLLTAKSVAGEDALSIHRVIKIVGGEPPRPSEVHPSLTPFDPVLEKLLAKDPKSRYDRCSTVIPALREALGQMG